MGDKGILGQGRDGGVLAKGDDRMGVCRSTISALHVGLAVCVLSVDVRGLCMWEFISIEPYTDG